MPAGVSSNSTEEIKRAAVKVQAQLEKIGPIVIRVEGNLPSLNFLLAAPLALRFRVKKEVQGAILSALETTGSVWSMRTISVSNSMWTLCAIAAYCLQTRLIGARLSAVRRKLKIRIGGLRSRFGHLGRGKKKS